MKQIQILPAFQSSTNTHLLATMEDGQLEKKIRSYGGILFTSALILGASFTNQQSLQVVLTQQQSLMTQQQALKTQQDNQEKSLITQQQALKTQLDNQEKGLSTLRSNGGNLRIEWELSASLKVL